MALNRSGAGLKVVSAVLSAMLLIALVGAPAVLARGPKPVGTGGTGTITLSLMDGATAAQFGNRVTFNVSTAATPYPYVHLMCYQNGALVLQSWQGFFPTALGNQWFYLGPSLAWQGGAASCTANVEKSASKGGWSVLGSTGFAVIA